MTRLIVEKLLLTPTEQLKALPDRETMAAYSDALTRLFSLSPDNGGPAARDASPAKAGCPADQSDGAEAGSRATRGAPDRAPDAGGAKSGQ